MCVGSHRVAPLSNGDLRSFATVAELFIGRAWPIPFGGPGHCIAAGSRDAAGPRGVQVGPPRGSPGARSQRSTPTTRRLARRSADPESRNVCPPGHRQPSSTRPRRPGIQSAEIASSRRCERRAGARRSRAPSGPTDVLVEPEDVVWIVATLQLGEPS